MFEFWIARRYLQIRQKNGFISFISFVSVVGIALGVAALIVVLSVMNGFQKEIRARILGVASHIEIFQYQSPLLHWQAVAHDAQTLPEVQAAAPFVNVQGLLSVGDAVRGAMVRGVDPELEPTVVSLDKQMIAGALADLQPKQFKILLGVELARHLGVSVGDQVTLITPQGQMTPAGMIPRLKQFTVAGLFKVDMFEYDASFAMIHLHDAQILFRMGEGVSGVRLRLQDSMQAPQVKASLWSLLPPNVVMSDWTDQNASYFRAVQIEKRMMFIILTLIVAVAAFNLVSTLVMIVTDKRADIAILRTLGASPKSIMLIFMLQGAMSGVLGVLSGLVLGLVLAWNLDHILHWVEQGIGAKVLSLDVYMIDTLPVDVQPFDVTLVASLSLFLALIATLYPSWRAANLLPAEALRYE